MSKLLEPKQSVTNPVDSKQKKVGKVCLQHPQSYLLDKRILYNFGNSNPDSERTFEKGCNCTYLNTDTMVISCDHCHGTGASPGGFGQCKGCGGRGALFLPEVCQKCGGTGEHSYLKCTICDGDGYGKLMTEKQMSSYLTESEKCQFCTRTIQKAKLSCIACKGVKSVLTLPGKIKCGRCDNTGKLMNRKCKVCKGTGWAFFKSFV